MNIRFLPRTNQHRSPTSWLKLLFELSVQSYGGNTLVNFVHGGDESRVLVGGAETEPYALERSRHL